MLRVGDYVVRKSYERDILFKIIEIEFTRAVKKAKLKGISYRVLADAPLEDLEPTEGMRFGLKETSTMMKIEHNVKQIVAERRKEALSPTLQKTVKVLHIDGDIFYLNLCMRYYEILGVDAVGEHIAEERQPEQILEALKKHHPSILVLTGHDALSKNYKDLGDNNEYKNSMHFIQAVKKARNVMPTTEELIIFAGACQSNFEEILSAGADYAASPKRILIHALDPVFMIERIVHCPFYKVLTVEEALQYTITNKEGLGGYEVLGRLRKGGPVFL
jgi:spore coat assembly protein